MQHLETLEADLRAPSTKIFSTIVERVTEFDQHVQGHQQTKEVLTSSSVNKSFNGDERPTRRECIIRCAEEMHLLLEIPVMQNHAHGDDIGFGQRVVEEVAGTGADAFRESSCRNVLSRNGFHGWQVERSAAQMRMLLGHFNGQQAGRSTDIA